MKISEFSPNVPMNADSPRGGINLCFDLAAGEEIQISATWIIAGRELRFVFLPAHQTLELGPENHYLKVIVGRLANLGRECFAKDFMVRTTHLEKTRVLSGSEGLLFALVTETPNLPDNIHDMAECVFLGQMAEKLLWLSFRERFGALTGYFDNLDNHMADGFHLLYSQGVEITYVNFWTCGKNGDVSTHNHAQTPSELNPAFAEVHLVLNNGTGSSGMYEALGPDADDRRLHVMKRGDEHGPYFSHHDGVPVMLDNGAVQYPWHGWQSGTDQGLLQCYDLVAAFEINPRYALLNRVDSI